MLIRSSDRQPADRPTVAGDEPLTPAWLIERVEGLHRVRQRGVPMFLTGAQSALAAELVDALADIGHDGSWRVVWLEPGDALSHSGIILGRVPSKLECQWLDADGDVQIVVEIDEQIGDVIDRGLGYWCEQCEQAWCEWREWRRDVDVQPWQTIKRAQGQRSADPAAEAPDVVL